MLGLFLGAFPHVAAAEDSGPVRYDLAACISRALQVSPSIEAAKAALRIAETQVAEARAARFLPKFDLTWIVGPSPSAHGNVLDATSDWKDLSAFTRTEISLVQPIYTFGKLDAATGAAEGGVTASEAGVDKSREDLEQQVAEAYYGRLLADELWRLAQEAQDQVADARKTVQDKLNEDTGEFTYTDLARIDRFRYDVVENAHKVEKERAMADAALRMFLGLSEGDSLALAEDQLRPLKVDILPLDVYLKKGNTRPDLRQLRAAIDVRGAQVQAARSDYFPQFFLGGQFKYSYAPNRDIQHNPFVHDDFNFKSLGAVVGIRQSLSFGMTADKVRQARLEKEELIYQERQARSGVALDVERAYRTLLEAKANVAAAEQAVQATRRWFVSARDGFNAGLEDSADLLEAVKQYGIIRAKYYGDVFAFNRAWVDLQRATGNPILEQTGGR